MKRRYSFFVNGLWVLLLILLPVTSFPLLSKLVRDVDVAPLSVFFLMLMVLVWLLPTIWKGLEVPFHAIPLLFFFLIALISCFAAFFLPIPSFRGQGIWRNEIESILTLGIGVCSYLVISLWLDREERLNSFFRIVNFSGAAYLIYILVQGFFSFHVHNTPPIWTQVQFFFSTSHAVFINRVNGLAFEPSWLAHQLNMFYLPIWLGLSLKRKSFHRFRFLRLSLENFLLIFAILALFLTFSRIGWLACLLSFGYCFLHYMNSFRIKIIGKVIGTAIISNPVKKHLLNLGYWLLVLLFSLVIFFLIGMIFARLDPRMGKLFYLKGIQEWGFLGWASKLVFAERVVYWIAGLGVFIRYPFLGVGLGNSGFFFPQTLNSFGYSLSEILRVLLWDSFLPNSKSLWIRLLAETGIIGFSTFISWLWVGWKTAISLEKIPSNLFQAVGIIGQATLIGLIIEGFSVDTFALPYFWLSLGLVVAAYRIFHQDVQKRQV